MIRKCTSRLRPQRATPPGARGMAASYHQRFTSLQGLAPWPRRQPRCQQLVRGAPLPAAGTRSCRVRALPAALQRAGTGCKSGVRAGKSSLAPSSSARKDAAAPSRRSSRDDPPNRILSVRVGSWTRSPSAVPGPGTPAPPVAGHPGPSPPCQWLLTVVAADYPLLADASASSSSRSESRCLRHHKRSSHLHLSRRRMAAEG